VRSCVRPVCAAGLAAGPNALRGSGPTLTQTGSPDPRNDRFCITSSCPRQFLQPGLTSLNRSLTQPPYSTSMPQSWRRPQHHKRTFRGAIVMSALPPKADIRGVQEKCPLRAVSGAPAERQHRQFQPERPLCHLITAGGVGGCRSALLTVRRRTWVMALHACGLRLSHSRCRRQLMFGGTSSGGLGRGLAFSAAAKSGHRPSLYRCERNCSAR
jgi:hypothetical protein